jgi:cell division protease FtsH
MQLPEKDRNMEGLVKLKGMLTGMMGGRVAEELVLGDVTSGAAGDLKEASHIARMMICSWGMSENMGPQAFGVNEEHLFLGREITRSQGHSDETARKIDEEVTTLLRTSYQRATDLLTEHRDKLEMVANLLLERETLDGIEVDEIIEHGRILSAEERTPPSEEPEPAAAPAPAEPVEQDTVQDIPPPLPNPLPAPGVSTAINATIDDRPSNA